MDANMQISLKRSEMEAVGCGGKTGELQLHLQCFVSFKRKGMTLKQICQMLTSVSSGWWVYDLFCSLCFIILPFFSPTKICESTTKRDIKAINSEAISNVTYLFSVIYVLHSYTWHFFYLTSFIALGYLICMKLMTLIQSSTLLAEWVILQKAIIYWSGVLLKARTKLYTFRWE